MKEDYNELTLSFEYDYYLNYIYLIIGLTITGIITLWLSTNALVEALNFKLFITLANLGLATLLLVLIHAKLNELKQKALSLN